MSRIFKRTFLAIFLLFGVISVSTSLLAAWILYDHMLSEYESKGRAIARSIVWGGGEVLLSDDMSLVQSVIDQYLEIPGVAYVFVADGRGAVVAHTFVPALPEAVLALPVDRVGPLTTRLKLDASDILDIAKPIMAGVAGYVHVGMDLSLVRAYVIEAILKMQALLFFIFWFCVFLSWVLVNRISRPLDRLTAYAERLADRDFRATVDIESRDEIGLLARTMRSMAEELAEHFSGMEQAVQRSSEDLQETLAHLRAIINNLADGLLVVDPSGRVSLSNPALGRLLGMGPGRLAGQDAGALNFPVLAELSGQALHCGDQVLRAELALPAGRSGLAVATSIRQEADGACLGAVILLHDVTREKELDRLKTEFISTVSHELRTPMTSVLGFAKIIKKRLDKTVFPAVDQSDSRVGKAVAQVGENVDIIVTEAHRLTELINDVLDIAKMEAGRVEWSMGPVSMAEVLDRSLAATTVLAHDKGLSISAEADADLPLVEGDRDRLIQVMVNLISNAVKFTDRGGVQCRAVRGGDGVLVSVADTGVGIALPDQEMVFEKFKQVGDTLTEKPRGTGLGLPICRQIVSRHGGRIWVESEPGQGSTFYFTLPLGVGAALQAQAGVPTITVSPPLSDLLPPAEAPLVLVVDDDPNVNQYLRQVLSDEGYRTAAAYDGRQALEMARTLSPDLVTMDLRMPEMDGRSAIQALRSDPATAEIPVVVITAVISEGVRAGGDAALVKPIDEDRLMETVHGLLARGSVMSRPCLVVDGSGDPVRDYLVVCPGQVRICRPDELWENVGQGFKGTVFVSATLADDAKVDLAKLSRQEGIQVVILPVA